MDSCQPLVGSVGARGKGKDREKYREGEKTELVSQEAELTDLLERIADLLLFCLDETELGVEFALKVFHCFD